MYDQVERGGGLSSRLGSHSSGSDDECGGGGGLRVLDSGDEDGDGEGRALLGDPAAAAGTAAQKPMRRYIAITVVEIVFGLAESAFWQVRRR